MKMTMMTISISMMVTARSSVVAGVPPAFFDDLQPTQLPLQALRAITFAAVAW